MNRRVLALILFRSVAVLPMFSAVSTFAVAVLFNLTGAIYAAGPAAAGLLLWFRVHWLVDRTCPDLPAEENEDRSETQRLRTELVAIGVAVGGLAALWRALLYLLGSLQLWFLVAQQPEYLEGSVGPVWPQYLLHNVVGLLVLLPLGLWLVCRPLAVSRSLLRLHGATPTAAED